MSFVKNAIHLTVIGMLKQAFNGFNDDHSFYCKIWLITLPFTRQFTALSDYKRHKAYQRYPFRRLDKIRAISVPTRQH